MKILRLIALSLVTMVMIPMGVNAHCESVHDVEGHPHCDPESPGGRAGGGGGKEGGGTYSADITVDIIGGSAGDEWVGTTKGVFLNTSSGLISTNITLDFFVAAFPGALISGAKCFAISPVTLGQVNVLEGKKGRTEARFFFSAFTGDVSDDAKYLIKLTGTFDEATKDVDWPPVVGDTKSMDMDKWETLIKGGASLKSRSCIGDGDLTVKIAITGIIPAPSLRVDDQGEGFCI